jgi:hypothetical protein
VAILTGRDIALTGIPRGGTTLACRLLGSSPGAVSLFEPMDVMALPARDRGAALDVVATFFTSSRQSLLATGRAPSKQRDGEVPDNPFGARGTDGRRVALASVGFIEVARPLPEFTLVVKHNAAFAALLPHLAVRFETLALVRNPVAVLASWLSVDLPVSHGHVPAGERLDAALAVALANEPARIARQLIVLDWFFARFLAHLPAHRVIRYEDVVATGGRALFDAAGLDTAPVAGLASRNASPLYANETLRESVDALLAHEGAWLHWYDRDALRGAAAALFSGSGP